MIPNGVLDPLLPRRGAPPATGVILGPGGVGKSVALGELAGAYERAGVEVVRLAGRPLEQDEPFAALDRLVPVDAGSTVTTVRASVLDRLGNGPWLLLVDNAHVLPDETLAVLAGVADRAGRRGGVIAAHRPAPGRAALAALDDVLTTTRAAAHLRPWTADEVATYFVSVGFDADAALAGAVAERTGGVPALVVALVAGAAEEAAIDQLGSGLLPRRLRDAVRAEINRLGDHAARVAVALAADVPAHLVAPVLPLDEADAAAAVATLRDAALVSADGVVPTAVRDAVLADAPGVEIAALHRTTAERLLASGAAAVDVAPHLVAAGVGDRERAVLVAAAAAIVASDPARALAWLEAAGTPDDALAVAAEASLRTGDVDRAADLADRALAAPAAARDRAAAVAAAVAGQRGQLRLAADRWLLLADLADSPTGRAVAAARAATAAAAAGDLAAATDAVGRAEEAKPEPAPLTVEADLEQARGVLAAAAGDVEVGLEHLVRAEALFGPRTEAADAAATASLVALVAGRDDRARQLAGGADVRRAAIRAWLRLRAGEIGAAEAALASVAATGSVTPRDGLLVAAVAVGVARRGTDLVRLSAAFDLAASVAASSDPELPTLPVVGELVAGAVRVSPGEAGRLMAAWSEVVERAGSAPVWRAHLDWWRVQWAAAASDADGADAAARDLAATAEVVPRFAAHAQAAGAWAAVLRGDFSAETVAQASDALAEVGLPWEASVIAGAAALRTTEAGAARALLGKGRDLRARLAVADTAAGAGHDTGETLSDREREVAALVVDGLTHREIGAQLYISAKTVEHHVARIRQKVGATTRAEMLAALRTLLADD